MFLFIDGAITSHRLAVKCFIGHFLNSCNNNHIVLYMQVVQDFVGDLSKHIEDVDRFVIACADFSVQVQVSGTSKHKKWTKCKNLLQTSNK